MLDIGNAMDVIRLRHSVRQYLEKKIPPEVRAELDRCVQEVNRAGRLNVQVFYDEPGCFSSRMAHYGRFEHADNYIALVGEKAPDLEERCGYWGEQLVLKAQALGLNTCWVALTRGKSKAAVKPGEREVIVISLGYGKTQGSPRRSKTAAQVSSPAEDAPAWFRRGVEAALLAPTAVNQQRFRFSLADGNIVTAGAGHFGSLLKVDLGIVKCHFELGAGRENFRWAEETGADA